MEYLQTSSVRVPGGGDKVYKDECVYCFNNPVRSYFHRKLNLAKLMAIFSCFFSCFSSPVLFSPLKFAVFLFNNPVNFQSRHVYRNLLHTVLRAGIISISFLSCCDSNHCALIGHLFLGCQPISYKEVNCQG